MNVSHIIPVDSSLQLIHLASVLLDQNHTFIFDMRDTLGIKLAQYIKTVDDPFTRAAYCLNRKVYWGYRFYRDILTVEGISYQRVSVVTESLSSLGLNGRIGLCSGCGVTDEVFTNIDPTNPGFSVILSKISTTTFASQLH